MWALRWAHSKSERGLPRPVNPIWRARKTEMSIGIDIAGGGGNTFHEQRSKPLCHMDAITPQMLLADEGWAEMELTLTGEGEGGLIVRVNIMGEKRRRFEEGDVGGRDKA